MSVSDAGDCILLQYLTYSPVSEIDDNRNENQREIPTHLPVLYVLYCTYCTVLYFTWLEILYPICVSVCTVQHLRK